MIAANVLSAALSPMLVYPVGLGLEGLGIANLVAQAVGGALFLRSLRAGRDRAASGSGDHAGAAAWSDAI